MLSQTQKELLMVTKCWFPYLRVSLPSPLKITLELENQLGFTLIQFPVQVITSDFSV